MSSRPLPPVVAALLDAASYPHAAPRIELIETHISYVVLTGEYAYKLKKTIDLGFLDFSTLAKRRHACFEELRLNRRLAPRTYIGVVALRAARVAGRITLGRATLDGHPDDLEYAVRMREFPQSAQLDRVIAARARPAAPLLEQAAARIARFHADAPRAGDDARWGTPAAILAPVRENFAQIEPRLRDAALRKQLRALRAWSETQTEGHRPLFEARRRDGFVRECHGDLHLTNLVVLEDRVTAFDCLEFDPALRWIDVISDVAFLVMDLDARGRGGLGAVFLNAWLEQCGDFAGLRLLRYYVVYRALVRAKVAAIELSQSVAGADDQALARYRRHADQATRIARGTRPAIVLMCGVSGSGKSWLARRLASSLPALRARSDVERKGLFDLAPLEDSRDLPLDIYSPEADRLTLARLADVARDASTSGYPLILDATFMRRATRERFRALADELGAAFAIVACHCAEETLFDRVAARARGAADPSEAGVDTVQDQLPEFEEPADRELGHTLAVRTDRALDIGAIAGRLRDLLSGVPAGR